MGDLPLRPPPVSGISSLFSLIKQFLLFAAWALQQAEKKRNSNVVVVFEDGGDEGP